MAANKVELQEAILRAVDAVVTQRNNELKLDKTITAIVKKNIGLKYGKPVYQVEYSGGILEAICQNAEDVYIPKTSVYVLVPEGNFSKEKIIIGRASSIVTDRSASVVAAAVNQFSIIGSNLLQGTNKDIKNVQFGLRSFHPISADNKLYHDRSHRYQVIYDKYSFDQDDEEDYSKINFDNDRLKIYKDDSVALMVRADFLTNLDIIQKQQAGAKYGLIFNFVFDNLNKGYGETNGEILENISKDIKDNEDKTIADLGKEFISNNEPDIVKWKQENTGLIDIFLEKINSTYLIFKEKTPEKNTQIVSATLTAYQVLINELKNYETINDIKKAYNSWMTESVGELESKIIPYLWTSDDMIGNPMAFNIWNSQYQVFNIDFNTLNHLESIIFFKEGFIENEEYERQWPISEMKNGGGPDIFVKNLQIYAMNPMDIQSGDYTLKVEPDVGYDIIFNTISNTEKINLKATLTRKLYEDLSENSKTSYLWFKEDSSVVNANSSNYHSLGGIGWRKISEKSSSRNFTVNSEDNQAYKNNYKCVAIYEPSNDDKAILSYPFVIYNKAAKIDLMLESDLGTHFSYDAGSPTIRILIQDAIENDEDFIEKGYSLDTEYPKYKYKWSIADSANNYTLFLDDLTLDNSSSENTMLTSLKQEQLKKIDKLIWYNNDLISTDIAWRATRIKYPISISSTGFTVTCYVQKQKIVSNDEIEYVDIGSASLEFLNQAESITSDYRIEIVNGDQVFQYDEYGDTPTSEKKKNPLEILPLEAKLFTPSGVEVSGTNYQVEWIFPIENTMISTDSTNFVVNPATNLMQIIKSHEVNFDIAKLYDPDAFSNQITCHISFGGRDYYKDTNFYFGKQGSNGTNGTDVVAKIQYVNSNPNKDLSILNREPLTLYLQNNKKMFNVDQEWDTNENFYITAANEETSGLKLFLYQKGTELSGFSCYWSIAGDPQEQRNSISKYFELEKNETDNIRNIPLVIKFNEGYNLEKTLVQNLRAKATSLDDTNTQTYYAFYSLPIIEYAEDATDVSTLLSINRIGIDKKYYLNEIVYNADGRNPIYNHNQGLKLVNIPDSIKKIEFSVKGGKQELTPSIQLLKNKDDENSFDKLILERNEVNQWVFSPIGEEEEFAEGLMIYVLPKDVFDGSDTNNRIEAICYDLENNIIATVYAPINMTLNTFGLASLNAWDGNTVTIDEEGGYVMAPQVGAGEKDSNNRFTGILMGKTETFTGGGENAAETGLFGYSHGLQSIFLDANTGNAYFGLPDGYVFDSTEGEPIPVALSSEDKVSDYNEGRIELIPGGESKIGGWKLGRSSMYYSVKDIRYDEQGNQVGYDEDATTIVREISPIGEPYSEDYRPNERGEIVYDGDDTRGPYNKNHIKDIAHDSAGILLQAGSYPYISIKGKPLEKDEIFDVIGSNDQTNPNPNSEFVGDGSKYNDDSDSYLKPGDSLELQLDPSTPSLFTIFRHNGSDRWGQKTKDDTPELKYKKDSRTFLAGINGRGEFVANSIRNVTTTLPAYMSQDQKTETSYVTNFSVNTIPAFGDYNTYPSYIGFKMSIGEYSLGQLFLSGLGIDSTKYLLSPEENGHIGDNYEKWNLNKFDENKHSISNDKKDTTLKISGGSIFNKDPNSPDTSSQILGEYLRPIAFYGRRLSLFSTPNDLLSEDAIKSADISNTHFILETSEPNRESRAQLSLGDTNKKALDPATFINLYGEDDKINNLWLSGDLESRIGRINTEKISVPAVEVSENEDITTPTASEESESNSSKLLPLSTFGNTYYRKFRDDKNEEHYFNTNYIYSSFFIKDNNNLIEITSSLDELYYKGSLNGKFTDRYISNNRYTTEDNSDMYYRLYRNPTIEEVSIETITTSVNNEKPEDVPTSTTTTTIYRFGKDPIWLYVSEKDLKAHCYIKNGDNYIPQTLNNIPSSNNNYYWYINEKYISLTDLNYNTASYFYVGKDPTKTNVPSSNPPEITADNCNDYVSVLRSYYDSLDNYYGYFSATGQITKSSSDLYMNINSNMIKYDETTFYIKIFTSNEGIQSYRYALDAEGKIDQKDYVKYNGKYYPIENETIEFPSSYSQKKHIYTTGEFEANIGTSTNEQLIIKTDKEINGKKFIDISNIGKNINIESDQPLFLLNLKNQSNSKASIELDTIGGSIGRYKPIVSIDNPNPQKILGKFMVAGLGTELTKRDQGLVITDDTFSLWGDSNGELRAKNRVWILAETTHVESQVPFYNTNNPQILLRAGTTEGVVSGKLNKKQASVVELMLNSSNTSWANTSNNLTYPVFAVRTTYNSIGIYPEHWNAGGTYLYRENFIVNMNQNISAGLQITGDYKGQKIPITNKSVLLGLDVLHGIRGDYIKATNGFDGDGKYIKHTTDLSDATYNKVSASASEGATQLGPGGSCTITITGPVLKITNGRLRSVSQGSDSVSVGLSGDIATKTYVDGEITKITNQLKDYATQQWVKDNYVDHNKYNNHHHTVSIGTLSGSGTVPPNGGSVNITIDGGDRDTGSVDIDHRDYS